MHVIIYVFSSCTLLKLLEETRGLRLCYGKPRVKLGLTMKVECVESQARHLIHPLQRGFSPSSYSVWVTTRVSPAWSGRKVS